MFWPQSHFLSSFLTTSYCVILLITVYLYNFNAHHMGWALVLNKNQIPKGPK
jgi:hypothetical protein